MTIHALESMRKYTLLMYKQIYFCLCKSLPPKYSQRGLFNFVQQQHFQLHVCVIAYRIDNFCINFNEGLPAPQLHTSKCICPHTYIPTFLPNCVRAIVINSFLVCPIFSTSLFSSLGIYFVINDYEMSIVGARTPDTSWLCGL